MKKRKSGFYGEFDFSYRMNLKLTLWTLVGLLTAIIGCFLISVCFSTTINLVSYLERFLTEGTVDLRLLKNGNTYFPTYL